MRIRMSLLGILALCLGMSARGESPAEELLGLVPADAGLTVAVEDLSGHLRTFLDSPLAEGLARLPAVRGWLASDGGRRFVRARKDIESALKVDAARVRDDLFGEAVVLALHLPPGEPQDRARGLLLTRVRDRALLLRMIALANDAERKAGALIDLADHPRGHDSYTVRTFRPGTKPAEAYAILGDLFAWSNSEALIQGVIDRRGRHAGLADLPAFREVRRNLPAGAAVSLFADPRFIERVLSPGSAPTAPQDVRAAEAVKRYLAALRYAGAALEWRDGPVLHLHEVFDPEKVPPAFRRWAASTPRKTTPARRAPATALALAAGPVDFPAIYDGLMALVPEAERPRARNVEAVLRGLLLGKDARAEVLPAMGPGVLLYVERPGESDTWPPWVASVEVGDPEAAKALENALRTALALSTLDAGGKGRAIVSRDVRGVPVTGLSGGRFAFAFAGGRFACAATPEAAAGGVIADPGEKGGDSPFERARAAHFPAAETFAFLDLDAIHEVADGRREALARGLAAGRGGKPEDGRRDLDQVLALVRLFRLAFATSAVEPDFSAAHRTIGLIARETR